jgi:hypothetical protein
LLTELVDVMSAVITGNKLPCYQDGLL